MAKYRVVYSKRKDENGDFAPIVGGIHEDEDGRHGEVIGAKGATNERMLLLAPTEADGEWASIQQTVTGQDVDGNDIVQLDLVYDEASHDEACWEVIRNKRNALLAECDWTVLTYSPLSSTKKTEWKDYRAALRAVPQTVDIDPKDDMTYTWPTKPA